MELVRLCIATKCACRGRARRSAGRGAQRGYTAAQPRVFRLAGDPAIDLGGGATRFHESRSAALLACAWPLSVAVFEDDRHLALALGHRPVFLKQLVSRGG